MNSVKNLTFWRAPQLFFGITGIKPVAVPSLQLRHAVCVLIALLVQGCSAPKQLSDADKSALLERVEARRECLATRDWSCAYQYLSPAYRRVFTADMVAGRYTQYPNTVLTGMKLSAYDRNAAVASVEVGVMSRSSVVTISADPLVVQTATESWLWSQGDWWFVPE